MGKSIDEFFKEGLVEPDFEMPDADWLAMEKALDKQQGRNQVKSVLYIWISGIAAMLIIAFLLFKSGQQPTSQTITKKQTDILGDTKIAGKTGVNLNAPKTNTRSSASRTSSLRALIPHLNAVSSRSLGEKTAHRAKIGSQSAQAKELYVATNNESTTLLSEKDSVIKDQEKDMMLGQNDTLTQELALTDPITIKPEQLVKIVELDNSSEPVITKLKYRKGLVFSICAGSDLNSVGSFKGAGFGTNAGLIATWQFSPKFSLSSGIVYAKKLYNSDYDNYKPTVSYGNSYSPTGISADCRVLDIPLNINYNVWNNNKGKIVVTGGASSYLMLKEKYDFLYADYTRPITYYGENQHYLGVLNFALAYERITSSKTSFALQPYVKIPVTGIGQGNVNLVSTGLSLNFNLNFKKKHD